MGVSENEVGSLNLLEYDALVKRKQAADNRERLNAGIIAAAVCNTAAFGDPDRKPVSALDFVPEWKDLAEASATDLRNMSPNQQRAFLSNMFSKKKMTRR